MKVRVLVLVLAGALAAVGLLVYTARHSSDKADMTYSGTIETIDASLAFQTSGIVTAVHAREGMRVTRGELLAELDDKELKARLESARATLEKARRTLEQARTVLDIQTAVLPEEVDRARAALMRATSAFEDARRNRERYEALYEQGVVARKERDAVRLAFDTALSARDEAVSAVRQARANLKRIDAARSDVEAARAQWEAARAAFDQASIQLGYARLVSPSDGIVTSRNVEPGEVVNPGREVITITDLSSVDLKIFVEETAVGKVTPGQKVDVTVDSFPGKVFEGRVKYVSPNAEFTPKYIQTRKERVRLVYLVKVGLDNPRHELKAGMPADAHLR